MDVAKLRIIFIGRLSQCQILTDSETFIINLLGLFKKQHTFANYK